MTLDFWTINSGQYNSRRSVYCCLFPPSQHSMTKGHLPSVFSLEATIVMQPIGQLRTLVFCLQLIWIALLPRIYHQFNNFCTIDIVR